MNQQKVASRKYQKQLLWKLMMGDKCMDRVKVLCEEYLRRNCDHTDDIGYGLLAGIVVTYAKPFTATDTVGMLSAKLARYSFDAGNQTHKAVLESRNRLFAHQDPDSMSVWVNVEAEDVGEHRQYKFYYGKQEDVLNPAHIPTMLQMTNELIPRLKDETLKVMELLFGGRHFPGGKITLNLKDDS